MIGPNASWPLLFIMPWPVLVVVLIGLAAIFGGIGFGAWWIISHLQWVW